MRTMTLHSCFASVGGPTEVFYGHARRNRYLMLDNRWLISCDSDATVRMERLLEYELGTETLHLPAGV